jgi:hypothetical protein
VSWVPDNLSGVVDKMSWVGEDRSPLLGDTLSWVAAVGAEGQAPDGLGRAPDHESPVLGGLSRVASRRPSTATPRSAARCRAEDRRWASVPVRTT